MYLTKVQQIYIFTKNQFGRPITCPKTALLEAKSSGSTRATGIAVKSAVKGVASRAMSSYTLTTLYR
jgi:hypothetical protein